MLEQQVKDCQTRETSLPHTVEHEVVGEGVTMVLQELCELLEVSLAETLLVSRGLNEAQEWLRDVV